MKISIIIRTYNEEKHLGSLLRGITLQNTGQFTVEVVVVDSGSTDRTLQIAESYQCKIVRIRKEDFTFGRSLNIGCNEAQGDYLVFISGHCVPTDANWLLQLIDPLAKGIAAYTYGKQVGGTESKFSECQLFRKYFPEKSQIPQEGFFCNNANAALIKEEWTKYRFNEDLTGLEDMELAARLHRNRLKIAYVAEAAVHHLHEESWEKIKMRYEREAIALQQIMPQIHIFFRDFLRYFLSAVLLDMGAALQEKRLDRVFFEIIKFRLMQFWGTYCGNNNHRILSNEMKERYFYPR